MANKNRETVAIFVKPKTRDKLNVLKAQQVIENNGAPLTLDEVITNLIEKK